MVSKKALLCFNDYESQLKAGVPRDEISFDPIKLGIKGADFWEQKHHNKAK